MEIQTDTSVNTMEMINKTALSNDQTEELLIPKLSVKQ